MQRCVADADLDDAPYTGLTRGGEQDAAVAYRLVELRADVRVTHPVRVDEDVGAGHRADQRVDVAELQPVCLQRRAGLPNRHAAVGQGSYCVATLHQASSDRGARVA